MRDIALTAMGAANSAAIEEEKLLWIEARLVVNIDMAREVRRFAAISPPLVAAP